MKKRYLFFGALLLNGFGVLSQNDLQPCYINSDEIVNGNCFGQDFILVFEDEFNDPSLDQKTWGIRWPQGAGYMNPDEPCQEWNTLDNVSINNGIATIFAKFEPGDRLQLQDNTQYFGTDHYPNLRPYQFTSSNLWSNYVFGSGYFEIKCKVPSEGGYWPAFWLYNGKEGLGNPELDIFEMWDDNPNDINLTIHNNNKMCGEMHHVVTTNPWYTIGAYWDDWKIVWMINNHAVQVTYRTYWPASEFPLIGVECEDPGLWGGGVFSWVNAAYPTTPMQIAFNLAVRKATTSTSGAAPVTMEVDYIRFYQQRSHCGDEETYATTASLGLDDDANIIAGLGKPYYHNITRRIINVNGNITVLNQIGSTQIPQQLKLTAAEEFNFNLDPNTGLPISNSSVTFDIQPGAIFEATIDPDVCSNTPYLPQRDVIDKVPDQIMEELANQNENGTLGLTNDLFNAKRVSVSPNPSNQDAVTIVSSERTKVIITNSLGIKVKELEVQAGSNHLNIQDLSSGVYQLYFETLKETVKLVRL